VLKCRFDLQASCAIRVKYLILTPSLCSANPWPGGMLQAPAPLWALAALALHLGAYSAAAAHPVLRFSSSGEFKLVQLTDLHYGSLLWRDERTTDVSRIRWLRPLAGTWQPAGLYSRRRRWLRILQLRQADGGLTLACQSASHSYGWQAASLPTLPGLQVQTAVLQAEQEGLGLAVFSGDVVTGQSLRPGQLHHAAGGPAGILCLLLIPPLAALPPPWSHPIWLPGVSSPSCCSACAILPCWHASPCLIVAHQVAHTPHFTERLASACLTAGFMQAVDAARQRRRKQSGWFAQHWAEALAPGEAQAAGWDGGSWCQWGLDVAGAKNISREAGKQGSRC